MPHSSRPRSPPRRAGAGTSGLRPAGTLRVEVDRRRPTARRLLCGLLEMSYVDLEDPCHLEFEYLQRMAETIDACWPPGQPIVAVHLGGAACTLARQIAATRPGSRSEVYEHDAEIVEIARRELGLRPSRALRVRVGDARDLLEHRGARSADLVVGDAFMGAAVPEWLLTAELARQVRRVLRKGGLYLLNVIDAPPLGIVRTQAATLCSVFPHVALTAPPRLLSGRASGNLVFAASEDPLPIDELAARAAAAPVPERVLGGEEVAELGAGRRPMTDAGS